MICMKAFYLVNTQAFRLDSRYLSAFYLQKIHFKLNIGCREDYQINKH